MSASDRSTRGWKRWWGENEWWTGPLMGLLVAMSIVAMSFTMGNLEGSAFFKALAAVLVGTVGAITIIGFALGNLISRSIESRAKTALGNATASISDAANDLTSAVRRVELALDRHTRTLLDQETLTDADLVAIEVSNRTRQVLICRQQMGDEFDRDDPIGQRFEQAVRDNLDRGVRYVWLTEENPTSERRAALVRDLFPERLEHIAIRKVSKEVWRTLPFSVETVFIKQQRPNGTHETLGFTDISFGFNDGSLWRQLDDRHCTDWYYEGERALASLGETL